MTPFEQSNIELLQDVSTTTHQLSDVVGQVYTMVSLLAYVVCFSFGVALYYRFRQRSRWIR
jgi:hypothetical protein